MKRILLYTSLICLTSIASCNVFKKNNTTTDTNTTAMQDPKITDKKWRLIELAGKPVAGKINGKEPFILLQTQDGRYIGTGGCNSVNGEFTLSDQGRIKFSQGISTMMACENMEIETGLNKALQTADNYTTNGHTLSLNRARMAPLARFEEVKNDIEATALNGTWEVNYVSGARIAFEGLYPNKKPTITFDMAAKKANGTSSCNNYNVSFTIDGHNIRFSDPMSTKMACEGNGESVFFNTLKTVSKFSVSGTTLNLIMGDIAVMRLEKK